MSALFFNDWDGIYRTAIVGVLAYVSLLLILRTSGKRTLSKLNAFDLVVTVALGSTLATILLNKSVALAEGATAFATLCALQYTVTWSSVRFAWVRKVVKSEPTLVWYRGQPLVGPLKKERVTLDEVQAAARSAKIHDMQQVDAVVLETDGTLSVIPKTGSVPSATLPGIDVPQ